MNPTQRPEQPDQPGQFFSQPSPQPASEPISPPMPQPTPETHPLSEPVPVLNGSPSSQPVEAANPFAQQPVAGASAAVTSRNPGQTLGIVSLVLALVGLGLLSLIVGIIGLKKSKQAGMKNGFALAGVIVGIIEIIIGTILAIILVAALSTVLTTCSELGSGTHVLTNGTTVTCNEFAP